MAKDAVATMGTILEADVGGRDAVHVAVISVKAPGRLLPGQHVKFVGIAGENQYVWSSKLEDAIGIVDPFLTEPVKKNQRFWLYLYPRTITSLRHNWTHPAFADVGSGDLYHTPAQLLDSEQFIRSLAEEAGVPYETLVNAAIGDHAKNRVEDDDNYGSSHIDEDYLHFNGRDAHGEIPDEFWHHVEVVSGRKVTGPRPKYFSCSC